MINIDVKAPYTGLVDQDKLLESATVTLLDQPDRSNCGLSIVLSSDIDLQQLNRTFLGVDAPTDVLAFPAGYPDPDSGTIYLGDILISYPRAQSQAEAAGHAVMDELQLLVVHGVLHLLGYDHADESEKLRMWSAQGKILDQLGLSAINPPAV